MAGIELYEGDPGHMIFRGISRPESGKTPYIVSFNLASTREFRDYTLYLPMYAKLEALDLSLEPGSRIEPPAPFKLSGPVVFYGSSFIQGGCASRPSMNLPAVIGRKLAVDIINLGFAGDGTYEPEMADLMAEIDAACFVIGPVLNDPELVEKNYPEFVARLRQKRPDCPILLMTRLHTLGYEKPFPVNAFVQNIFEEMRASGDRNIYFFDSF
ncbi:MAG TPA: SGNH/GDSL hydrolase family protein, partial [Bacteroidales bacterium]|nr:SGNH/GDSL hydrolase family protein [Bacteroidales bacterium]